MTPNSPRLSVSIVIPTFNRAAMLKRSLPTYLASDVVAEVLTVDDASTDNTAAEIEALAQCDPRLRSIRNERNLGAPASRNRGAIQARGDWILQSEDDLTLTRDYLDLLLDHAQQSGADVIAGRRIWMRLGESQPDALARANQDRRPAFNEWLMDYNSHAFALDDAELPLLDGTMLIRRQVFDQVRYHEAYGGQSSWREESDFQLSALECGFKLVFCPHAVAYHYPRSSRSFGPNRLKGTAVYAYRIYHNNLVFLRRHRDFLRARYPRALLLGSPLLSALLYGAYRTAWLLVVEILRAWRARKHGAFSWQ